MRLIRYLQLRRQGFSIPAATALSSGYGDSTVGVLAAVVLIWLLADSIGSLF